MTQQSMRPLGLLAAAALMIALSTPAAFADSAGVTLSDGDMFSEKTGQELYANVCQACHMDQGQGAIGAGKYPALAKNQNLESGGYPVFVVLHGLKGMPPVGTMMSDEQVAAVVNYVRTNFGNDYKDPVTTEDVAGAR
ncbi:c-type cytochrome [Aminobacter sp. HY435]|uniref:c-type cytochrome n=1 Tax=Aminobacter sp. HY435 TaxID=2970917 RepID=UPI0022B95E9E|nr:cytochrome c [Aminobacter sp. HY435]